MEEIASPELHEAITITIMHKREQESEANAVPVSLSQPETPRSEISPGMPVA